MFDWFCDGASKLLQRRQERKNRCAPCRPRTGAQSLTQSMLESCALPRLRDIDAAHKQALDAIYQRYRHLAGPLLNHTYRLCRHVPSDA